VGARIVEVRIRLGSGIAQLARAPLLTLHLPEGATVDDAYARLAVDNPELAPALRSALPVIAGTHADRQQTLRPGVELALLAPVSGG
jgi:molybdopterin synthase sulfur carrier subunit